MIDAGDSGSILYCNEQNQERIIKATKGEKGEKGGDKKQKEENTYARCRIPRTLTTINVARIAYKRLAVTP
jgi:hypothetical protein